MKCRHRECNKRVPEARVKALEGLPSQYYCISHAHLAPPVVRTVVPMHESNYVAMFNVEDVRGINNKGGLVR